MTVKDLKNEIRELTGKINERIAMAYAQGNVPPQIEKIISRLQKYGSKPSITNKSRDYIGLGFRGKKKGGMFGLETQHRELTRYLEADVWTPEGMQAETERARKAYESFTENQKVDWSYDKWRDFVQTMGDIPNEVLNAFGYEKSSHKGSKSASLTNKPDFVNVFESTYEKNINMGQLMIDVYNKLPEGADQTMAMDMLNEAIKENMS